jgi:threonine 3-dehydrogenase
MKALIKKERRPGLWLDEVPVPTMQDHEVMIRPTKMSICGTDVHIYKWDAWAEKNVPTPMVIGHEFTGEIVEVGKNVKGLKVGDRVSGEGHLVCGVCTPCKMGKKHLCMNVKGFGYHTPGCFAEYFTFPGENVFLLPPSISDEVACILDPLGNAAHTALSFPLAGEDILITGAGPIGMMAAAIARKGGARHVVVTDVNEYRLDLAKKMGATTVVNVAKTNLKEVVEALGIDYGFTFGMEMSGSPQGLNTLLEHAQNGAKIALLGILPPGTAIDWDLVIFKMLEIKGIYGREIFSTWFKVTHLLESGLDVAPVITHQFKMDEFQKGFDAMMSGQAAKVVLSW